MILYAGSATVWSSCVVGSADFLEAFQVPDATGRQSALFLSLSGTFRHLSSLFVTGAKSTTHGPAGGYAAGGSDLMIFRPAV